jgi:Protein of unknown function (DUF2778)
MAANLTYYIVEGVLTGFINGRLFHVLALSGGAGGSTKHLSQVSTNNPYMEGLKTSGGPNQQGHVHGGPVPPGKYKIERPRQHPHLGLSARLVHPHWKPMGRDGFFIHGRGPHGSDGCIVPLDSKQFQDLMNTLTQSNGGTLVVEEAMGGNRHA